jgi:hypothetical protein
MKTKKNEKVSKKFDLEKMKVAKLTNSHLVNGGNVFEDKIKTITDLSRSENTRTA